MIPGSFTVHGIDFGASAAWGAGVNMGIEFGIGAENPKGKQVWAAHGGIECLQKWKSPSDAISPAAVE
ncbi:hypothetical protein [Streptomyces marianii]|uniref:Uncharacterized protein n=1 Tax=Streptomyces marianii TaxID=1817406 RepID=A0A5R9EBL7_9ACTN|nr:hypothetical protein [Streptomyces marianii]TLQ47358.1 hypothetical protein FEF34_34325 [Streptomyces marianii]